jgi:hypothetical protein
VARAEPSGQGRHSSQLKQLLACFPPQDRDSLRPSVLELTVGPINIALSQGVVLEIQIEAGRPHNC